MITCNKCGKDFEYNSHLKRHQSLKRSCDTINNITLNYNKKIKDIDDNIKNLSKNSLENNKCLFCKKCFSNKANTQRHITTYCVSKQELDNNKNKLIDEKNKLLEDKNKILDQDKNKIQNNEIKIQNEELKKMLEKILEQQMPGNITQNNQVINNNTINNNLIVNINSYGKEDLSHITIDDYKKYLNGFFPGFIKFIQKIHFDKDAPGNHNICITNIKSKYMYVYEDNDWILKDKNDTLDKLISRKYNLLVNKCDELEESKQINTKIINNFREFEENYDNDEAQSNTKKRCNVNDL